MFGYLLPHIADYGKVWDDAKALSPGWIAALGAVTVVNVVSNAAPWVAALPGLGAVGALRVALGAGALSIITPGGTPVGIAAEVGMLRSWGVDRRAVGLAAALANLWGQLASLAFPLFATFALAASGGHDPTLEAVALVGLALLLVLTGVFAVGLSSATFARRAGDRAAAIAGRLFAALGRRPAGWDGASVVRLRLDLLGMLRRRWLALTIATLVNQLAVFAVLIVALRAVGVSGSEVSLVDAFAAWSIIRVVGKLPITPGGLGIEEIALVGALVGFGAGNTAAVSATLMYRFLTIVPIVALGLAATATYRVRRPRPATAALGRPSTEPGSYAQRPGELIQPGGEAHVAESAPETKLGESVRRFQGKGTDLAELAGKIGAYLRAEGFEVQSSSPSAQGVVIQARKAGFMREFLAADRALTIVISGLPDDFTVRIGIGRWFEHAATTLLEAMLLSSLFLAIDVGAMLWNLEIEERLIEQIEAFVG